MCPAEPWNADVEENQFKKGSKILIILLFGILSVAILLSIFSAYNRYEAGILSYKFFLFMVAFITIYSFFFKKVMVRSLKNHIRDMKNSGWIETRDNEKAIWELGIALSISGIFISLLPPMDEGDFGVALFFLFLLLILYLLTHLHYKWFYRLVRLYNITPQEAKKLFFNNADELNLKATPFTFFGSFRLVNDEVSVTLRPMSMFSKKGPVWVSIQPIAFKGERSIPRELTHMVAAILEGRPLPQATDGAATDDKAAEEAPEGEAEGTTQTTAEASEVAPESRAAGMAGIDDPDSAEEAPESLLGTRWSVDR